MELVVHMRGSLNLSAGWTRSKRIKERKALIERGDKWLQLRGRHIQEYRGHAVNGGDHAYGKFNSHGRVVLDPVTFDQVRPNNSLVPRIALSLSDFTDEHKLLVDPVLYGFSLRNKIWGGFAVSSLTDVLWENEIIDSLVIPEDQKDFVRTLVESHLNSGFEDIVRDKGKGLVGLLSGPPGVGKTLTAEAVAEIARRPLYMVSSDIVSTLLLKAGFTSPSTIRTWIWMLAEPFGGCS
ncbi:hypothetical protein FJTKL_03589 [Diaporthe vaccinii]|uniref:ATPase AAA-type core domain-containing protein n=1 Tax=Diaporthe vaccinii TaxID=105482 RepID=A0ABR4DV46_9PEZI